MIFAAFPVECPIYEGPHTPACMRRLWLSAGCTPKGLGWPREDTEYFQNQQYVDKTSFKL